MSVLDKLEKKLSFLRYPPLMLVLIIAYAAGFILMTVSPGLETYLVFYPELIFQGQVWRFLSFMMLPSTNQFFMALLTCFIYFSISRSLEQIIGRFRVNIFLILGYLLLVLAGFVYWLIFRSTDAGIYVINLNPHYLYAMFFVLFALIFPDARFLFMFIIPIRGKWMIFITLGLYALNVVSAFVSGNFSYAWILVFMITAAVLTVMIFLLLSGYRFGKSHSRARSKVVNMNAYQRNRKQGSAPSQNYRHKCALCGRTDKTNPELDFRYCSKCQGAWEYCSEHLYTHIHVGSGQPGSADNR